MSAPNSKEPPAAPVGQATRNHMHEQSAARTALADLLAEQPEWQELALCSQTWPDAFYPEKGGSSREAKRICGRCEVKQDCKDYALQRREPFGIWGGLTERERRKILRRAR